MYYDPNRPFSIDQWNALIQDVNVILSETHGPNCWTNTRLDEVEDPHLWSVNDVQMARDALSETCPDIIWHEELVLWKQSVINEIVQNMTQAWCHCDETEQPLCTLTYGFIPCGAVEDPETSGGYTVNCPGHPAYEVIWDPDTFYPIPSNGNYPLMNTIDEKYNEAINACKGYITAVNRLLALGSEIITVQDQVDEAVAAHEDFWANYYQEQVDAKLAEFGIQYSTMLAKRTQADSAAATNWDAAARLQLRFPSDCNIIADYLMASIINANWGDWWDPETRSSIGSSITFAYGYLSFSSSGPAWPTYVVWYHQEGWSADRQGTYTLRISPGGVPFICWGYAEAMCRKLTIGYYTGTFRWFCDRTAGTCGDGAQACTWGPWREPVDHYWDQGYPLASSAVDPGNFIIDPIHYELTSQSLYRQPETWHLEIEKPLEWQHNNTAKQQAFWNTYLNWYEQHPPYTGPDSM